MFVWHFYHTKIIATIHKENIFMKMEGQSNVWETFSFLFFSRIVR